MERNDASNREKLERAEEERVSIAKRSTIPGIVTHQWNSAFYALAMRQEANRRKAR